MTLAVLEGRLEQIADEMDATLFRSAFNPIIAEAHDASHGLYHAETGETLVQGKSGLPIFVGATAFAVKAVIEKFGAEVADGDVFVFNDPYAGGTHLSDFRLVRPYFREGRLYCWLASVGHWHDVGGNVPGNYNPAATECFQEGMLIPPVRLYAGGALRRDVVDIVLANSRLPGSAWGDLNGQINALGLGVRRLDGLLDGYGAAVVSAALDELRARAARMMESLIAELPDGRWSAEDWLDNDGRVDAPLRIALDLTIRGGRMTLDFTRSAAACAGPVNIARSTTVASCYVALKHLFPEVPANAGVMAPIEVAIAEGSLLSAEAPRPVGGYTETILRIIDVVFSAFAQVAPDLAKANAYGTINAVSLAGHRRGADGAERRWVMFSFFGGGHGGTPEGDGLSHGNAPISTATIPPVEILEAAYPVMVTQWALRPGSAGPGRHRGGLGAIYEIELLEREAEGFLFGERVAVRAERGGRRRRGGGQPAFLAGRGRGLAGAADGLEDGRAAAGAGPSAAAGEPGRRRLGAGGGARPGGGGARRGAGLCRRGGGGTGLRRGAGGGRRGSTPRPTAAARARMRDGSAKGAAE